MARYKFPDNPILLVDDEQEVLEGYNLVLSGNNINNFELCNNPEDVMLLLSEKRYSVIIMDLSMPKISGQELIDKIRENYPGIPIIVVTAVKEIDTAINCIHKGIYDYMVKPVEANRFISNIRRVVELNDLKTEVKILRKHIISTDLENPEVFSEIITNHPSMKSVFKYIEAISPSPKPVFITGESGVGKELVAKAIHKLSGREGKFVPVNISGLDDTMFTDTLFGHKKGAYTGAEASRDGLVKTAEGGTIFLDEIGDLDSKSQVKLLRLLQENQYYALGSDKPVICNVRVITATNADIEEKQKSGEFRKDLYYRLMTHYIHVPPLNQRFEDLYSLVEHFVNSASVTLKKGKLQIPDKIYSLLESYHFPGNIRELESMIYNAVSLSAGGMLSLKPIEDYILKHRNNENITNIETKIKDTVILSIATSSGELPSIEEAERYLLTRALERAGGNQSIAAPMLGMTPSTFCRHLKKHDIL